MLDIIKVNNEEGLVFSPQGDKPQIINGNKNDQALGYIQAAWGTQVAEESDQPGQWSIAETPLKFTSDGTFLTVTSYADHMVSEFLNMTFLDEDWCVENMDIFGMLPNETVMDKYFENHDGADEYYSSYVGNVEYHEETDSILINFGGTNMDQNLGVNVGVPIEVPLSIDPDYNQFENNEFILEKTRVVEIDRATHEILYAYDRYSDINGLFTNFNYKVKKHELNPHQNV